MATEDGKVYVLVMVSLNGDEESRENIGIFSESKMAWDYGDSIPVCPNVSYEVETWIIDNPKIGNMVDNGLVPVFPQKI